MGDLLDVFSDFVDLLRHTFLNACGIYTLFIGTAHHFGLDIVGCIPDAAHTLPKPPGDLGNLVCTKYHHQNKNDEGNLRATYKKGKCLHGYKYTEKINQQKKRPVKNEVAKKLFF